MKDYPAGSATSISILCREINRDTGEIAVYLCKKNVDSKDLHNCGIRARVNPELRYYATRRPAGGGRGGLGRNCSRSETAQCGEAGKGATRPWNHREAVRLL